MSSMEMPTLLPCGCKFYTEGEAFVFVPHSPTCSAYADSVTAARKQGKPIRRIDVTNQGQMIERACPYCHEKLNGFTGGDTGERPTPGSVSVCAYCAKIAVFTEDGMRKPSIHEAVKMYEQPDIALMVRAVRKLISENN